MKKQMKFETIEEYVEYRNIVFIRAKTAQANFRANESRYYWKRLRDMDYVYPQFKGMGIVQLKKI